MEIEKNYSARMVKIRNESKHIWSDWCRLSKMAKKVDSENYQSLGRQRPERSSGEFISSVLVRFESGAIRKVQKNEAVSVSSFPHVSREDRLPGVHDTLIEG